MDDPTQTSTKSSTPPADASTSTPDVAGRIGTETKDAPPADPPKDSAGTQDAPKPSPLTGATLASGVQTSPRVQHPLKDNAVTRAAEDTPDSSERERRADADRKAAANGRIPPSHRTPAQ